MDCNERKIVQELVTALGSVIPATDGYEPRTNLWNKYTAAKNMLAAAPQVVADERALSGEEIVRMAYEKFGIVADDMEIASFVAEVRRLDGLAAAPVPSNSPELHGIAAAPVQAAIAPFDRQAFIKGILLSVAEIPDRTSPEDQPEMMLVTGKELSGIIESQFEIVDYEVAPVQAAMTLDQIMDEAAKHKRALVPLHVTRAMQEIMDDDGWQWGDVLGAAEAITDQQYAEIQAGPGATVLPVALPDGGIEDWLGHALELESLTKRVESQTVLRAMESAAQCLRLMGKRLAAPAAQGDKK